MLAKLDLRRIGIFLALAFAIAWITGLVIQLTGGLIHSPEFLPGSGITLAVILLATVYMWAPALAHFLTRVITREGRAGLGLWPNLKRGWPFWIAAWFLPAVMTIVGAVFFFLLFPQYYDPTLASIQKQLTASGQQIPLTPWMIILINTVVAILLSPLLNSIATFGEEFGWRGYLLPKLLPLGGKTAAIVLGVIWGIWHWPVIAMGYEYGFDYAGFPWVGFLAFPVFTILASIFLAWITIRSGSIWPAVIGHAAINGIAGISFLFLVAKSNPPMLLGPSPVGLIGAIGYAVVALILVLMPKALATKTE